MEHGELVQHDVDLEHKHDHDLVLPVMLVVLDVLDHQLNHEPVEWLSVSWEFSRRSIIRTV